MENKITQKINTKDIKASMEQFASDNELSFENCDFKIDKIDTYIKNCTTDKFVLFEEDINQLIHNEDKIEDEHIEISQTYTITMFVKKESLITLDYSLKYNQSSSAVHMIISPNSIIPHKSYKAAQIYKALLYELTKIKAKNNIIINLSDAQVTKKVQVLVQHIYKEKFTAKIKIPIFIGIEPILSKRSSVELIYKNREGESALAEVQIDEKLIEYTKAIFGKNGLNVFGETIMNDDYLDDGLIKIDDKTIKIVEDDEKRLYISKVKGFVEFENNYLSINNKINIHHISSTQKAVFNNEDNNVEVYIAQGNHNEDDIGEGCELTSETIHVTGHVGAKTILHCRELTIDGATHDSSQQYAKEAHINRHKGTLTCHKADIKVLEGGEVHASEVNIGTALSGCVYAHNVNIDLVKHNLKIYASQSITIEKMSGEDNLLKINHNDVPLVTKHIEKLREETLDLKCKLQEAQKHNPDNIQSIQDQIEKIQQEQLEIKQSCLSAKISIKKQVGGINTVVFTIDNNNEIIYKTQESSYEPFYIELKDDQIVLHPVEKKAPYSG